MYLRKGLTVPPEFNILAAMFHRSILVLVAGLGTAAFAPAAPVTPAGHERVASSRTNSHWAFVSPRRPEVPTFSRTVTQRGPDSPRARSRLHLRRKTVPLQLHPVDAFVRQRLEREGLKPAPEADRATLIRRVSLDLLGLPPTPAEVQAFVDDASPDAFEQVVDRLLASPHFGERWGRHWLDVARYADSNGYSIDAPRSIWKYRDWVIEALNRDLPFDQFTVWQLAGDLIDTNTLPKGTLPFEPLIATGFHRNTQINQEGGIDPEQFRIESVLDRVNTTATAWLGLTLACAQCHDHKYDPFTQRDYYSLYAFFNSTIEDGHGKGSPDGMFEVPGEHEDTSQERLEVEGDLDRILNTKGSEVLKWEQSLAADRRARLSAEVNKALAVPFAERTPRQKRAVFAAFRPEDPEFKPRQRRLSELEKAARKPVTTLVLRELPAPRESHVFVKGDFTRPGEKVIPAVPVALSFQRPATQTTAESRGELRATRLDLARWLVATNQPLTARVIVNRVWQQYFGRGLVETENDLGTQGTPPSHPELLDWLACELMNPGVLAPGEPASSPPPPWSLKHIHRLIVTSATYCQSSHHRPELAAIDPGNRLLARQSRLRLDAEAIRDVALAASGLLNPKVGGPSVFPPQPDGVMNLGQSRREWKPSAGAERYRRGMYTFFWRATPHPALMVFDAADGFSACTRRVRSNTPLQALTLLNDEAFYECARALAARVLQDAPRNDSARIEHAFRLCLARRPEREERARLLALLQQEKVQPSVAWTTIARTLLNLDETITRE